MAKTNERVPPAREGHERPRRTPDKWHRVCNVLLSVYAADLRNEATGVRLVGKVAGYTVDLWVREREGVEE